MRCFNHLDQEAVGLCKSCGRGLCPNCAAEVEKALACRGRCESDVLDLLSINRNALQFAKSTKQARFLGPALFMVVGVMLMLLGFSTDGIGFAIWAGGIVTAIGAAF